MPLHRRDFMKMFGVSLASLFLSRCHWRTVGITSTRTEEITCYEAPPEVMATDPAVPLTRDGLRLYWLRFGELAQSSLEDGENRLGQELIDGHLAVLDELVAMEELTAPVAELIQEAYEAAVYHVWRSNAPITCYKTVGVDYAPSSAAVLIEQARVLNQLAAQGSIDPATLEKAQAALEHDMAFYALTEEEVQALYAQLLQSSPGQPLPSFDALTLELTPESKEATQFIIDLLTGK